MFCLIAFTGLLLVAPLFWGLLFYVCWFLCGCGLVDLICLLLCWLVSFVFAACGLLFANLFVVLLGVFCVGLRLLFLVWLICVRCVVGLLNWLAADLVLL